MNINKQYDKIGERYIKLQKKFFTTKLDKPTEAMKKCLPDLKGKIILDIGCGHGKDILLYEKLDAKEIWGMDSSQVMINEAKKLVWLQNFKGYIHDVGGPTANFRQPSCENQAERGVCKNKQCLFPKPCKNLKVDHSDYLALLRKVREISGIKKVFIRSGIRFDYLILDENKEFFNELCEFHISGQLKVAPEHISDEVLDRMGKPKNKVYQEFCKEYNNINQKQAQ